MEEDPIGQISVRFVGEDGNELGGAGILLPTTVTPVQLQILCNQLLDSRLVELFNSKFSCKAMIQCPFHFSPTMELKSRTLYRIP